MLLPIVLVFLVQFGLVVTILRTLRSILSDLGKDDQLLHGDDEPRTSVTGDNGGGGGSDKMDDRAELCKNWVNAKSNSFLPFYLSTYFTFSFNFSHCL